MSDWIEHNGRPQPVADDVWVEVNSNLGPRRGFANGFKWHNPCFYRILNQHLIDAKQAEIDALRDDLETWQSVFPHVMPDRLKSDQQLADEDVAAKIDAARLEGIRLGLEAAAEKSAEWQIRPSTRFVDDVIRNLNPDTIAKETQHD